MTERSGSRRVSDIPSHNHLRLTRQDTHIYGLFAVVLHGAWTGTFFHGLPAFDLEAFCAKASELKVNSMHIVPPVALALAASPIAQKYDMSSVRRILIAAAPLKVWHE